MTEPSQPAGLSSVARTDNLQAWVGCVERAQDVVTPVPLAALAATLDRDDASEQGEGIAPLRHWLYFLPITRRSELGDDGHPRRGGFLPPIALPRRMWAGGRLEFHRPLRVGDVIERESRIVRVDRKQGRTGELVFVLVRHEVRTGSVLAITEEHDIVYREHPHAGDAPAQPQPAPGNAEWRQEFVPDEVLLFRYSALTFNGHRIHYDRRYVTEVEGYPGLVVHGPLTATLLVDLAREHTGADIEAFSFRAVKPLFDTAPFMLCGREEAGTRRVTLWAQDLDGHLALEATATLR